MQRNALLGADVGLVLLRLNEAVARNNRPVRTQTGNAGCTDIPDVPAVVVPAADARTEVVQAAQLEAVSDLPDAAEHGTMTLIRR